MDCHICTYWTKEEGCAHYGPDPIYTIANEVVAFAHLGNKDIKETGDFMAGIKYTLLYLQHKGIKITNS